jgi:phenylacetate-CoA ligase
MIRANHPLLIAAEVVSARQPFRAVKGLLSAYCAYPFAEHREGRKIRPKLVELRKHYDLSIAERMAVARRRLFESVEYARCNVPYYKDVMACLNFDPEKLSRDVRYLEDLPFLTKEIIREQGDRMLAWPLAGTRHHACKTGGSTGLSCVIYYDQDAADYSAAVTLYARERAGKKKCRSELHFACRFPDEAEPQWPTREDLKCFAMNRSNIFFDRVDDDGLERIWRTLKRRRPYLVHGHPSTIYALACYIERAYGRSHAFSVFESSGELLEGYMREKIAQVLQCRVIDRYGLAELGVMAYQTVRNDPLMHVFESEGWPECRRMDSGVSELVFTSFRNRLMPLLRYATGDIGNVVLQDDGLVLTDVIGRIHDVVSINGVPHLTHHVQDMLDHRVGGIQEFQIDLRFNPPVLRIVPEALASTAEIAAKVEHYWPGAFKIDFVIHDDFIRVGRRAKFRHVVTV